VYSSSEAERVASLEARFEDSDAEFGAPAGAVYEEHDSGIIKTLQGISDKAEAQLDKAQQEESTALENFEMLKQSLEDEISHAKKEMAEAKAGLAASGEEKAVAEGELVETKKEIRADAKSREDLERECMAKAQDYEATTKSREEELSALAEAKKAIAEATGGPETSFLQVSLQSKSPDSVQVPFAVVRRLRELGKQQNSAALSQLAARMATTVSLSTVQGADPFKKVRGMISDMLERLEKEAAQDATQKAYCDKELAETKTKKQEKGTEVEDLSTKLEQMSSRSAKLKEQVATLQTELADIAKSQAEMDAMRKEERSAYMKKKAELEEGLEGVKLALKVLRDYYGKADKAHDASDTSSSLISMIEVCESDFSKGLSETVATEESAQAAYDEQSKDNEVDKASKEEAVKFKTKEAAGLDKSVSEYTNDRSGVQAELDAVLEYLKKLEAKCIGKPDSYEERKDAREKELAGLKEALSILEGEETLVQFATRRSLRGVHIQDAARG
jgi:chromosome segregation ATPase